LPERLPFPTDHFAAIGGLDTLGHCASPAAFFAEIERCLCVGGRAVFVERWMGGLGGLAHALRGQRRLSAGLDPWFEACDKDNAHRENGNAATARACLDSRADELPRHAPALEIRRLEPFAGLAELCSLSRRCTRQQVDRLMAFEHRLPHWLRRRTASRVLVILEKISLPFSEDNAARLPFQAAREQTN
jgi:SAM-dependent methyltransferase